MRRVIDVPWHVRVLVLVVVLSASATLGQTTAFTYQGQLSDGGTLASGSYDVRFGLFDSAAGGAQIGANQTVSAVAVSDGVFTVQLDFGVNAFPGANRFVEIAVRPASVGSYTTLAPRQQISSSPYAIRTLSAATADALSSACVGCVTNAQIQGVSGSKVSGTIPAASVPTGSGNYVQNTTTPQANANFNIAGNGVVGGNLTVAGTLNANVSGNFIQNRTTPQAGANFNVGNGTVGGVLSAGSVGIGTSAPSAGVLLEVNGLTRVTPGGSGAFMQFGTPSNETGMSVLIPNQVPFVDPFNRADVRFNGSTLKFLAGLGAGAPPSSNGIAITTAGDVGIGSTTPGEKLEVAGSIRAIRDVSNHLILETTGGTNAWARLFLRTPSQRWSIGSSQNFNGNQFYLVDDTLGESRMTIQPDGGAISLPLGNVGIGTGTPAHRLSIADGPFWTTNNWKGALEMTNGSAIGWKPNTSSGQSFGLGQSNGGLYFFRTLSSPGAKLTPALYDLQITDNGDLSQPAERNGTVKAMLYVASDGTIIRCYNGVTGTSSGKCGFDSSTFDGNYNIDFDFQVSNRFAIATAGRSGNAAATASLSYFPGTVDQRITVRTSVIGNDRTAPADFTVVVY